MIVELFGPPGAGKTTFARALAARLEEDGYRVDLFLSHRPAERPSAEMLSWPAGHTRQFPPVIERLMRPLGEMLAVVRHPSEISRELGIALHLVRIMPPSDIQWRLRLIQYLARLFRTRSQATDPKRVILFDQGFIQAVCSLAMLCKASDEAMISRALDEIPKPNLAVLLNAPSDVVKSRLRDRERRAGRLERLLELDLGTSLRSINIVRCLDKMLREKGVQVANAASLDPRSLQETIGPIEAKIAAQHGMQPLGGIPGRRDSGHADQARAAKGWPLARGN